MLALKELVNLGEVAVGVGSQRDDEVAHFATNAQLWQQDRLTFEATLPHRNEKIHVEVVNHLGWRRYWLSLDGALLVLEKAVGDLEQKVLVSHGLTQVAMLAHSVRRGSLLEIGQQEVPHRDHPLFLNDDSLANLRLLLVVPQRIVAEGHLEDGTSDFDFDFVFALA